MNAPVTPRCHIPWQQMVIDSTGNVAPCCYWGAYENLNPPIGNINENTVEEIWNNERFQELRKGMASGDLVSAGCGNCYALHQGVPLGFEYDADCENEPEGQETEYAKNIEVLKKEVAEGATILKAKPTVVSYTPSHRCNIRCTHCYQESTRTAEISRTRASDEVNALAVYLTRIVAGGGEPFLLPIWRQFLDNFDIAKNPYLAFSTSTNATIVTPKILEALSRFKSLVINISVDGTAEAFERVRVGATFAEVRDNIRKLKEVVDSSRSPSKIGLSMCVMKSNIQDLPNFVDFCLDEDLMFGMSPVITLPPDESLRCFNDPASEIAGWSGAVDEAKAKFESRLLTVAKILRKQELEPELRQRLLANFDLLKGTIPFDVAATPHYRVKIAVPLGVLEQISGQFKGQALAAYIFREGHPEDPAEYWGKVEKGMVEVSLPTGRYCLNIATKWASPGYWEGIKFTVNESNPEIVKASSGLAWRLDEEKVPADAELLARYSPEDLFCADYWANAGASVQDVDQGRRLTTPVQAWHYAAAITLDLSAADFGRENCWVRIHVRDADANLSVALYDPATNEIGDQTVFSPKKGEATVALKAMHAGERMLMFRTSKLDQSASAIFTGAEILAGRAYMHERRADRIVA